MNNSFISRNTQQEIVLNKGFTDAMKFVAAILVAFGHYAGHALSFSNSILYRVTVAFAGNVGVAIFFFLSGYGLMMSEKKRHLEFWPFIKRRISKVYLPVVLVSFIWQLILWPKGAGVERIPQLLYATFWGFSDGILWFVKVILGLYLFFYLYVSWKKRIGGGIIVLLLGTCVAYAIVYIAMASWAAISIPLFTLGIVLANYSKESSSLARSWWFLTVFVSVTLLMGLLYIWKGNLYLHCLTNWYVILTIVVLCAFYKIKINTPTWVGGISYDIYLTHNKVLNYLRPIYCNIGLIHFIAGTLISTLALYTIRKSLKL